MPQVSIINFEDSETIFRPVLKVGTGIPPKFIYTLWIGVTFVFCMEDQLKLLDLEYFALICEQNNKNNRKRNVEAELQGHFYFERTINLICSDLRIKHNTVTYRATRILIIMHNIQVPARKSSANMYFCGYL